MDERMTLEQVRDCLRAQPSIIAQECADAIDAHLTQPAQAVDVDGLMSQAQVFASAWALVGGKFDSGDALENAEEAKAELRAKLTRAIGNAQAEGWLGVCDDRKEHADGSGYVQIAFWNGVPDLVGQFVNVSPTQATPNAHE